MANVALLATVADSKASQQAGGVSALMPSGVVLPYAGSTSPTGWLACDGTAYNQADYPELFAALGSTYNAQVNPTTGSAWAAPSAGQFRVPDMRGLFLRGEGTASGGDAVSVGDHQVGKTAKNGLGNGSSSVGGTVGGGDGHHDHRIWTNSPTNDNLNWASGGTKGGWCLAVGATANNGSHGIFAASQSTDGYSPAHGHGFSHTAAAQAISGDNETRPTNRGVKYIIKA